MMTMFRNSLDKIVKESFRILKELKMRRSNRLSYQAMSSARTHSQFGTATPISPFVQYQISFRLMPSSAATSILMKVFMM